MTTSWLYTLDAKGNLRQWRTWADGDRVFTEYGRVGGKMQRSSTAAEPKNVGRSNETSAEEQAIKESAALYMFRLRRKYVLDPTLASKALADKPMLAMQWEGVKKKSYPAYIQPKIDGLRCLAVHDGQRWMLMSRSGTVEYNLPHIVAAITRADVPSNFILDGEIYKHGMSFQKISSLGRKLQPLSSRLEYHVYDCVNTKPASGTLEWQSDRFMDLADIFESFDVSDPVVMVETKLACNEDEAFQLKSAFLEEGYEGAIMREPTGVYRFGKRSSDLIKMKNFDDTEFRVVGYREGRGRLEGCAIWICDGPGCIRPFECKQAAPDDFLAGIFKKLERSKLNPDGVSETLFTEFGTDMLKVKHMGYTDDGLPRHPVGIGFRGIEDM